MTAAFEEPDGEFEPTSGPLVRGLWWLVSILAALLVLAVVAIASTALLSPDAFVDSCHRSQLVTPLGCDGEGSSAP